MSRVGCDERSLRADRVRQGAEREAPAQAAKPDGAPQSRCRLRRPSVAVSEQRREVSLKRKKGQAVHGCDGHGLERRPFAQQACCTDPRRRWTWGVVVLSWAGMCSTDQFDRHPGHLGDLMPMPVGSQGGCLQAGSKGETQPITEAQTDRPCQWHK